jgi:hypothetical protein
MSGAASGCMPVTSYAIYQIGSGSNNQLLLNATAPSFNGFTYIVTGLI